MATHLAALGPAGGGPAGGPAGGMSRPAAVSSKPATTPSGSSKGAAGGGGRAVGGRKQSKAAIRLQPLQAASSVPMRTSVLSPLPSPSQPRYNNNRAKNRLTPVKHHSFNDAANTRSSASGSGGGGLGMGAAGGAGGGAGAGLEIDIHAMPTANGSQRSTAQLLSPLPADRKLSAVQVKHSFLDKGDSGWGSAAASLDESRAVASSGSAVARHPLARNLALNFAGGVPGGGDGQLAVLNTLPEPARRSSVLPSL